MNDYIQNNLRRNEVVILEMKLNKLRLAERWIYGILFCWVLLLPLISAIVGTIEFRRRVLVLTNLRVLGKKGAFSTTAIDVPLDKIQNIQSYRSFFGNIFHYGTLSFTVASKEEFSSDGMKNVEEFKAALSAQAEQIEEDRMKKQAELMAMTIAKANAEKQNESDMPQEWGSI